MTTRKTKIRVNIEFSGAVYFLTLTIGTKSHKIIGVFKTYDEALAVQVTVMAALSLTGHDVLPGCESCAVDARYEHECPNDRARARS